ncbi:unnamed protein product [Ceutorhynchus assimilis]|uniref:Uncharacterized protein n=1 Tax=Ceutorhynchus assimilis TaxID=467358 RepID=A0A9N9QJ40_9CUCU|nr:unnamed protein product [Ceutorhynchus assimilis]
MHPLMLLLLILKGHLRLGAQISSKDINGLTIIHYAVDSNEMKNVQFAVETQLDINQQDHNGWTPLIRAAIQQCKPEILEYLIEKGADKSIEDRNGFGYEKHLELSNDIGDK